MNDDTPACSGLSWLFDASDAKSHASARIICSTCPVIVQCRKTTTEVRTAAHGISGSMEGTWAGVLFKPRGKRTA